MLKLRDQIEHVFKQFDGSSDSAVKLKAQTVITCEKLASLSSDNHSMLIALALRPAQNISPPTHHAFCCAIILSKMAQQSHYHSHYTAELISAAITMRIGLDLNNQQLTNTIYQRKKLSPSQQQHYHKYPLHSANFLNKAKVVSKNVIYTTLQHQELLDGSGYPKKLSGHHISQSGQLLSLINKFVELVTPRHQREPFSVSQSLSYLARRPQLYNTKMLEKLTQCLTTPAIGMVTTLSKDSIGIIESVDWSNEVMMVQRLDEEDGKLTHSSPLQKHAINQSLILKIAPSTLSDPRMHSILGEHEIMVQANICLSISRLKPSSTLTSLLQALNELHPEHDVIAPKIACLPSLGDDLIATLTRQYPSHQFNNSFHALQMAGFVQSRPLLSLLALRRQLNYYQFPALGMLESKVDTLLSVIRHIGEFTREVLPNELAMFALLNMAPLYLDKRVHQTNIPEKVDLECVSPLQAASLFGLPANPKQFQIINTLARLWENNSQIKQLLQLENDLSKTKQRAAHELVQSYQLALILTHQMYHGLSLEHQGVNTQLTSICRRLKISGKQLKQLSQLTLGTGSQCPLGSL